jgi:hypothetical protein
MAQTEITYTIKDGVATITGYKNILTWQELINKLGLVTARKYIGEGVYFYYVDSDCKFIRVGTSENNTVLMVGSVVSDIDNIIKQMKIAGARLSELVHGKTVTVRI